MAPPIEPAEWGEKWRPGQNGTRVEVREKTTGQPVGVRFCRLEDGQEVSAGDITVERVRD